MQPVRARVDGSIRLLAEDLPAKSYERLLQRFTLPNPEYGRRIAYGRGPGDVPDTIQIAVEEPDALRVPRGAALLVRELLAKDGAQPTWIDCRSNGLPIELPEHAPVSSKLRYYQSAGIEALADRTQGSVVIGCGGGKTIIGVGAIERLLTRTLIIVHTGDLASQWQSEIQSFLGSSAPVGVVGGGKKTFAPITIAIDDSLVWLLSDPELASFGLCILDECHHVPSATLQKILPFIPARYRLGLTATPFREDGLGRLIDWSFGPRLVEKTAVELIAEGFLLQPELEVVETEFEFKWEGPQKKKMAALQKAIVSDEKRNRRIVDVAVRDAKEGQVVAILSNHRQHCRTLGRMCWEAGIEAAVLVSNQTKAGKAMRDRSIEDLRSGKLKLVVATSLLDEGVSINSLSRIVLALPQKARAATEQKTGRLMRLFEDKKPKLYDFVDRRVDTLEERWLARRRIYKQLGMIKGGRRGVA